MAKTKKIEEAVEETTQEVVEETVQEETVQETPKVEYDGILDRAYTSQKYKK